MLSAASRCSCPLQTATDFFDVLQAAVEGKRLPTIADDQRMNAKLAAAPIGPVEDLGQTVTAHVRELVEEGR